MITIRLSPSEIALRDHLAQREYLKYKDNPDSEYKNTIERHMTGQTGQIAASSALSLFGIKHIRGFEKNYIQDLIVPNKICIEVKTWKRDPWDYLGHALTVDQSKRIVKHSKIALWVVAEDEQTATIIGWNYLSEIQGYPVKVFKQADRNKQVPCHQVPLEDIRSTNSFLEVFFGLIQPLPYAMVEP